MVDNKTFNMKCPQKHFMSKTEGCKKGVKAILH